MYSMYLINYKTSKELLHSQHINLIMDEAVVDSLNVSFFDTDNNGIPIVDREELKDNIIDEAAIGLMGNINDDTRNIIESRIMFVMYLDRDGYYCYRNGKWSDIIRYNSDVHTDVVNQISDCIEGMIGNEYKALIPYNDGENYKNTIDKYSCLVFYEQLSKYYCFSGARIQLIE